MRRRRLRLRRAITRPRGRARAAVIVNLDLVLSAARGARRGHRRISTILPPEATIPTQVEELKRRDSTQPCLHVAEPRNLEDAWAAARAVANSDVDGVDLPASPELVTPELVEYLHGHDKRVAVWVYKAPARNDAPAVWDALSRAGVDAFTSNLPPELIL